MAAGDIVIFDEAKATMVRGDWASTDIFHLAILDNTVAPTKADVTPALGDYTEVGAAGNYVAGGVSLGALSVLVSQLAGVMKLDSAVDPTWAANALNDADAFWALIYNFTNVGKPALGFVDLGGPVDMSATPLTVTWNALGVFTIADAPPAP